MTSYMIPLASSEVVRYNGYSTKVPHIRDFQGVTRNTDKIKGHAAFSMGVNGRLIT